MQSKCSFLPSPQFSSHLQSLEVGARKIREGPAVQFVAVKVKSLELRQPCRDQLQNVVAIGEGVLGQVKGCELFNAQNLLRNLL